MPGGCTGSLTLLTAQPVAIGGVSARVGPGSARFALRAGQRRTLTLALPAARRAAVAGDG